MNISSVDKTSKVYNQCRMMINDKVNTAAAWLGDHKIEYSWNCWIDNHLYRMYIPAKELLLDFEPYPMNNINYNYCRINYNTDIVDVLERIFPKNIMDTQELEIWKINQRTCNRFLRENNASPIYDKSVLRLAWVKDSVVYQCIVVRQNKIIANVIKRDCAIPYGTYMMLRYLNEMFGFDEILINTNLDNSFMNSAYRLLNLPVISRTCKKKIWWNPDGTKWHIDQKDIDKYIPFYFTEHIIYKYPPKQ